MKVGILSMKGNFIKDSGQGVQKYIYHIWRSMLELDSTDKIDKLELGFGRIRIVRMLSFTLLTFFKDLSGYDVISIPAPILCNPLRKGRAKIVTTLHELPSLDKNIAYAATLEREMRSNPLASAISGFVGNRIMKQVLSSDELIVNSTKTRDEAIKIGYDKRRIHVVKWGLEDRFLKGLNKPAKTFTVGYLGGLVVRKNVDFAIRAFKQTSDSGSRFMIYGKGPEHDELVALASDDKRIEFMGFAAEDRLVSIYESFSVFVYPSLYEGLCLPILEAQARGLPVIIYKNSSMPKEIREYCLEAKNEKEMACMIMDIKKNGYDKKLQDRATKHAREYTWKNAAKETIEIYRKACQSKA